MNLTFRGFRAHIIKQCVFYAVLGCREGSEEVDMADGINFGLGISQNGFSNDPKSIKHISFCVFQIVRDFIRTDLLSF